MVSGFPYSAVVCRQILRPQWPPLRWVVKEIVPGPIQVYSNFQEAYEHRRHTPISGGRVEYQLGPEGVLIL